MHPSTTSDVLQELFQETYGDIEKSLRRTALSLDEDEWMFAKPRMTVQPDVVLRPKETITIKEEARKGRAIKAEIERWLRSK
ncbi:hypothetical protein HDU85_006080 [Gaertneriomyces sp. JEL0708]|nr:hypothetical protein HDU85_006080 [Gaertneriomyces sp. JEL0708]